MLHLRGKKVTGSDTSQSEITDDLEKLGIRVHIGQKAENLDNDVEAVIYTIAIPNDNRELQKARNSGLPCISYPEALGEISKKMFTIAVSGTHGKTTTTAMIGHILKKAGLDPTIIVGSKILGENTNFQAGKSQYLVVEACEYKRSFLNLQPSLLVITNIEPDHLDYYKDLEDIRSAFREIAQKVPKEGSVVAKLNEDNIKEVLRGTEAKALDYGKIVVDQEIGVPGQHNILNAQAAICAAENLGVKKEDSLTYLKDFKGTWRRLEYKGEKDGNIFYDDYAHHPTEIAVSLSALKAKYPNKKIVCIFEPHQQSRTKLMFDNFVKSLQIADQVLIAPIFITREIDDGKTTNTTLAQAVAEKVPSLAVNNVEELKNFLGTNIKEPACVVLMGAGNIYKWTEEILK
jgi:UDP-N-acetylmuramate--alanine ligase